MLFDSLYSQSKYRLNNSVDFLARLARGAREHSNIYHEIYSLLKETFKLNAAEADDLMYYWTQDGTVGWNIALDEMERSLQTMLVLERHETGVAKTLLNEFGIRDFGRYPIEMLRAQYDERDNRDLPYGIIMYPFSDWNGAFTYDAHIFRSLLEQLNGRQLVRIVEGASRREMTKRLIALNARYAPANRLHPEINDANDQTQPGHRISWAIVGGHGEKFSIQLGPSHDDDTEWDIVDFVGDNYGITRALKIFDDNPSIVLASCSTGQEEGIGQQMSTALSANITAPNVPTSIRDIKVLFDQSGKATFITEYYKDGATKKYSAGSVA